MAIKPPIKPMLAQISEELPAGEYLYEPKWDGFRAIVFRGKDDVYIQSRDERPLDRYFPELREALLKRLPRHCVVDGEIVIAGAKGLDFDALQLRLHPAASRVARLAKETPSSFVAFDVLAAGKDNLMDKPQSARRAVLVGSGEHDAGPRELLVVTRQALWGGEGLFVLVVVAVEFQWRIAHGVVTNGVGGRMPALIFGCRFAREESPN